MDKNFSLEAISDLLGQIEEKGRDIVDQLEIFLNKIKLKREIYRVQDLIDDEYIKMGRLLYDLNRLDKDLDIEDFQENFTYVAEKKSYLAQLEEAYERLKRLYPDSLDIEDLGQVFEKDSGPSPYEKAHKTGPGQGTSQNKDPDLDQEDYISCPKCQTQNSPYVAQCIKCGQAL